MQTLTYGMQVPNNGDFGSAFYPALAANFTQLDGHTHNGTDSPKITTLSLSPTTQAISHTNWVLVTGGIYRQAVTIPGGLTYDNVIIDMRDATTGHYYDLTIEKISNGQYYVYINDNTVDLTAYYGI